MSELFDMNFQHKPKEPPRVEQCLVAVSESGEAFLVVGRGAGAESDIDAGMSRVDEAGPTAVAKDMQPGLWVWEGFVQWFGNNEEGHEPDYARGTWRRPTPEEVAKIQAGDSGLFGPPHINREPLNLGPEEKA